MTSIGNAVAGAVAGGVTVVILGIAYTAIAIVYLSPLLIPAAYLFGLIGFEPAVILLLTVVAAFSID